MENCFKICLPATLATILAQKLHEKDNFHFNFITVLKQLKNYIYAPYMNEIVKSVIKWCGVCMISNPKRLKSFVGQKRSEIYLPGQCFGLNAAYLPTDKFGFSKALICVNLATSYIVASPLKSLKQQHVTDQISQIFCCIPLPI